MILTLERGIYLASRSPRRRELLAQIGVRYHLLLFRSRPGETVDVDESTFGGETAEAYVERMARAKVAAGWQRMLQRNLPRAPVLSADTTVAVDGKIFMTNDDGETFVVRAGPKFELLHVNQIGERTLASPALVDGKWYMRTDRHLVAVGLR